MVNRGDLNFCVRSISLRGHNYTYLHKSQCKSQNKYLHGSQFKCPEQIQHKTTHTPKETSATVRGLVEANASLSTNISHGTLTVDRHCWGDRHGSVEQMLHAGTLMVRQTLHGETDTAARADPARLDIHCMDGQSALLDIHCWVGQRQQSGTECRVGQTLQGETESAGGTDNACVEHTLQGGADSICVGHTLQGGTDNPRRDRHCRWDRRCIPEPASRGARAPWRRRDKGQSMAITGSISRPQGQRSQPYKCPAATADRHFAARRTLSPSTGRCHHMFPSLSRTPPPPHSLPYPLLQHCHPSSTLSCWSSFPFPYDWS